MNRIIATIIFLLINVTVVLAQPPASKEQQDLERERQQLKKELEQAQRNLDDVRKTTKENLSVLGGINHKLRIQENMVANINREINLMDNNIYKSQRDINKLQLLLDTLKQEYAKSMVYAYKNRSNSDFLNFIFSSSSFNDAIKRVNYLKSYRAYREMQGDNILRTQTLLKTRIEELSGTKKKKGEVLEVQSKEADALQAQQEEKNKIVEQLKAKGKELNNQIAAKKKQMAKVNNAIAAAIKRAIKEANDAAAAAAKAAKASSTASTGGVTKTTGKVKKTDAPVKAQTSVLLATDADVKLNASFEGNKRNLPWPVSSGYILLHYGSNTLANGVVVVSDGISIGCDVGTPVKSVFEGEVVMVNNYDDVQMVVIKHGRYFSGYSNIAGVTVSKGQSVKVGQVIGKAAANLDGIGAVDLQINNERGGMDPAGWLKPR